MQEENGHYALVTDQERWVGALRSESEGFAKRLMCKNYRQKSNSKA